VLLGEKKPSAKREGTPGCKPLRTVEFILTVNGRSRRRRAENVTDPLEAALQILRTTKGVITFAPIAPEPPTQQRDWLVAAGLGGGRGIVRRRRRGARRPRAVEDQLEFWPGEIAA
jgi:hypothetical protein